ncbi:MULTISPECIES: hypothetical protein [unclassified Microcoleus]|uniref:hypothetical protein n=1 Tax=unclassified Microcoleus TaxID=2642155 RepID=UPI002FD01B9D
MATFNSTESQPTAVQLAFPWGEEQILDNSPASPTKHGTQQKTSSKKQHPPQVVVILICK